MTEPLLVLATASEIRAILNRAIDAIDAVHDEEVHDGAGRRRQRQCLDGAIEALRFCSHAAGLLRDPSLMPELVRALEAFCFDDFATGHTATLVAGVTMLLEAGAPIDAQVRALAAHEVDDVRAAVASGLRADRDDALALLATLAADTTPEVRTVASAKLATVREVPWWIGKFASDPLPRVPAEQQAGLAPVLARVAEVMDVPGYERAKCEAEFVGLLARVPDPIAIEAIERWLLGAERFSLRQAVVTEALLARAGAPEALVRLFERWCASRDDYTAIDGVTEAVAACAPERRDQIAMALLAVVPQRPSDERYEVLNSVAVRCAQIVAAAWRPDRDPTPVLDAAAALPLPDPPSRSDYAASALTEVLANTGFVGAGPVLDRVLAARMADYEGASAYLSRYGDEYLARVEGSLVRPTVEAALQSGQGRAVGWALECLIVGTAWDPARDAPRPELARRLFDDPRLRESMIQGAELRMTVVPALRAALREGSSDLPAAHAAMLAIDALWGLTEDGTPGYSPFDAREDSPETRAAKRAEEMREAREQWEPYLGPEALHGPATAYEWSRYRAARDAASIEKYHDWLDAMLMLPPGPLCPEDRAFFERGLAYARSGHGDRVALPLALALAGHGEVADMPLFDELATLDPDEDATLAFRDERRDAYARLGLANPDGADDDEAQDEPTGDVDDDAWPDDDDDDDDDGA